MLVAHPPTRVTAAPDRDDEAASLAALTSLDVLDTAPEAAFDALVRAAALVCGVPISLISLIDRDRQWFKANLGLDGMTETPRDLAFCAHAVLGDELFEIPDTTLDHRFAGSGLVTGAPNVRFYAGMPIRLRGGHRVGTICVIDREPRQLDAKQREVLACLAEAVAQALEGRRALHAIQLERQLLRRSEDLLDRTNKLAGIGGWQLDLRTSAVYWSDETCRIHGVPPGHVPALESAIEFYAPEARPVISAAVAASLAGGPGWDLELPMRRADGAQIWVRTVGSTEFVDGQAARIVGAFQDVTERVRERDALRDANARVALATDTGRIGVWEFDLVTRTADWDPWMYRLYGLPPGNRQMTLADWEPLLPPASLAAIRASVAGAVAGTAPFELEFHVTWPDGSDHVLHSMARVARDADGRATKLVGANWDVTEARRLAAALQAQTLIASLQASIAMAANGAKTLDEALGAVIELLCKHVGWAVGHVFVPALDQLVSANLWNRGADERYAAFRAETAATTFTRGHGLVGAALDLRRPLVWRSLGADRFSRWRSAETCSLRAGLAAPVIVGEDVVAVLEFYAPNPAAFDGLFVELLAYAGLQLGRVVDRTRAQAALEDQTVKLREAANIDELTGLYNRRGFIELAADRIRTADRTTQRVFLLFADLDGMKAINDTFGHAAGDRALVEAAGVLKRTLRASDVIARLGGDEFVALTSETGSFDGDALVARLGSAVELVNAGGANAFVLAISFGVSGPRATQESIQMMLQRADELMYAQKQARKANQQDAAR